MKKIKLYLDTSVVSALDDPKKPERKQDTHTFWDDVKVGMYEIYLSDVVFKEINKCNQSKQDALYGYLNEIEYVSINTNEEIEIIANHIIQLGILQRKKFDDCMHIGCSVVSNSDYLVSWNFNDLVNIKTVNGVRAVTNLLKYKSIDIIPPLMLINKED